MDLNNALFDYGNEKKGEARARNFREEWGRLKRDAFGVYESILKAMPQ